MSRHIHVSRDGALLQAVPLEEGEYSIGRTSSNAIVLDDSQVSSRHALIRCEGGTITIEDCGSTNGTYVDDTLIRRPIRLTPSRQVRIGGFTLVLDEGKAPPPPVEPPSTGSTVTFHPPGGARALPADRPGQTKQVDQTSASQTPHHAVQPFPSRQTPRHIPASQTPEVPKNLQVRVENPFTEAQQNKRQLYREIRREIHQELFKRMDLKRMVMTGAKDAELLERARRTVDEVIDDLGEHIPKNISRGQLAKDIYDEAIGLGPLEPFLADTDITEVMVNGPDMIYYEKKGKLHLSEGFFLDENQLVGVIERIVAPIGRRIDESQPMVDARLKDGSRVNAIIPPLSLKGPCLTIRKFSKTPLQVADLIRYGSMMTSMAEFFRICVMLRKNILISGGTGSGKTTLLNVLSNFLPTTERIVTIEDAAELRLNQHHVVTLEARPPNIEGKGAVTIRDLVRNALRMRPDRIVVGECRGGETLDMLQAMNTGHDGSLTTIHANSPRDGLSRVETLVLMAGMDLPMRAIREQVTSAIDIIIHQDRFSDGTRKISSVAEIVGMEQDVVTMQELFKFNQTGIDSQGKVLGYFTATGNVPTFMDEIRTRGLQLDPGIFDRAEAPV
ncbi:MAG: ATPase, T2SS/T4P/T4SS family [Verrucomicrobiae bacterium]|nr:ATPase, T2SS/T4P/T4SS family [Verrucomicrobiae bacterium]